MTDAFVCDRCDAVETLQSRVAEYHLPDSVCNIRNYEDAIDVNGDGHLCEDCSRAFARWLKDDDDEDDDE